MKNKSVVSTWIVSRLIAVASVTALAACSGMNYGGGYENYAPIATPTVDYVEQLDVYSAPHQDSFLNQLAMNYRSYAIYNARTSGYSEMGEMFANKAVAAFSGEVPFPETMENWPVNDAQETFALQTAYGELMDLFKNDATESNPQIAAEAQAKFDCWLSAAASGQVETANNCRDRFNKAIKALRDCEGGYIASGAGAAKKSDAASNDEISTTITTMRSETKKYYPDTNNMAAMRAAAAPRDGVIIVNNVNVPEHLINPVPVQPMVFNQNIYGADKSITNSNVGCMDDGCEYYEDEPVADEIPTVSEELVTRQEFINMMMAMRAELAAINARLDKIQAAAGEKTMIKVQQIPLEPTQHVMEEVFEIRFDFNKATIKPEYEELIRKLADATQSNRNIKVSVVGHTDTMGSKDYNYALGGRRADAVQKMLIKYGIPASQIVAVSAGEEDLAVPTPDGVANAENRRVRVVKEVHYTETPTAAPVAIEVEEVSEVECGMYGCAQ